MITKKVIYGSVCALFVVGFLVTVVFYIHEERDVEARVLSQPEAVKMFSIGNAIIGFLAAPEGQRMARSIMFGLTLSDGDCNILVMVKKKAVMLSDVPSQICQQSQIGRILRVRKTQSDTAYSWLN